MDTKQPVLELGVAVPFGALILYIAAQVLFGVFDLGVAGLFVGAILLFAIFGWKCRLLFQGTPFDYVLGIVMWLIAAPTALLVGSAVGWLVEKFVGVIYEPQLAVQLLQQVVDQPWVLTLWIFMIVVLAPLVEEFLFRGLFQTWLRNHFGPYVSIILASLLFALVHYGPGQGWSNLQLLVSLFIFSLFLGGLFERRGNLISSIVLHGLFNLVGTVMTLAQIPNP